MSDKSGRTDVRTHEQTMAHTTNCRSDECLAHRKRARQKYVLKHCKKRKKNASHTIF